jgi:ribosomal protein S18 acetylase RimI-like enzyme
MITLAPATEADVDAIVDLAAEMDKFYGDVRPDTPLRRAAEVTTALFGSPPLAYALLAWDESRTLAGFAAYSFLWPAAGLSASLYLKELYVAVSARRLGVGTMLMRGLYRIAAERGCSRVEWTTDRGNEQAQAFYAALEAKSNTSKVFYRVEGDELKRAAEGAN